MLRSPTPAAERPPNAQGHPCPSLSLSEIRTPGATRAIDHIQLEQVGGSMESCFFFPFSKIPAIFDFSGYGDRRGTEIRTKAAAYRLRQGGADEAHLRLAARGLGL